MTDHKPMPVKGYTSQSASKVQLANELKEAEERYLRMLERLMGHEEADKRLLSLAFTAMQQANMWAVRSIFRPDRITLPEDNA